MKGIADLIREHSFLADLDGSYIGTIAGCGKNVRVAAQECVHKEGATADQFFLIRRGKVALLSHIPGRGDVIVQTLGPGQFLGASWLVPPYRWKFTARAVEDAHLIAFDAQCLRGKCDADHDLGYALMLKFVPALVERLLKARFQALDVYGA